jgi:hypothetical protein
MWEGYWLQMNHVLCRYQIETETESLDKPAIAIANGTWALRTPRYPRLRIKKKTSFGRVIRKAEGEVLVVEMLAAALAIVVRKVMTWMISTMKVRD